ncbi:MAG: YihY/virulence factor BrkB family protein [Verrucomicrobiia bacterium]
MIQHLVPFSCSSGQSMQQEGHTVQDYRTGVWFVAAMCIKAYRGFLEDMGVSLKTPWNLLKQTASDWSSDNAPRLGAALAYYTVFSISPLMIIVVAIAGIWFGQEAAQRQIVEQVSGLIGTEGAEAIQGLLRNAWKPRTGVWATVIAIATLLVGSTGVFVELQAALNTVWGVQTKSSASWFRFIWDRVISFAMVLAIGFLLLVSLVVSAALSAAGQYLNGLAPDAQIVGQSINLAVSFVVITLLFALIFKILPDVKIAWRDVWIGAAMTTVLFTLGKFLLGLYLGTTGVASTYGAAGSVVVILIWVYYSAQILFFGAEFTQVYASHFGRGLRPVDYAEPITVEDNIPSALKRRGAVPVCIAASLPRSSTSAAVDCPPSRGRWKTIIPLAALAGWAWWKVRGRKDAGL